jgi:hypothetical protein
MFGHSSQPNEVPMPLEFVAPLFNKQILRWCDKFEGSCRLWITPHFGHRRVTTVFQKVVCVQWTKFWQDFVDTEAPLPCISFLSQREETPCTIVFFAVAVVTKDRRNGRTLLLIQTNLHFPRLFFARTQLAVVVVIFGNTL